MKPDSSQTVTGQEETGASWNMENSDQIQGLLFFFSTKWGRMKEQVVETVRGVVQDSTRHGPEQHDLMTFALSSELDETALWGSLPT